MQSWNYTLPQQPIIMYDPIYSFQFIWGNSWHERRSLNCHRGISACNAATQYECTNIDRNRVKKNKEPSRRSVTGPPSTW